LESAASSVALNIAEGRGRNSKKEFIQFLYIARGSLYETVTIVTIFKEKQWINSEELEAIKQLGEQVNKMLSSLISSVKRNLNLRTKP